MFFFFLSQSDRRLHREVYPCVTDRRSRTADSIREQIVYYIYDRGISLCATTNVCRSDFPYNGSIYNVLTSNSRLRCRQINMYGFFCWNTHTNPHLSRKAVILYNTIAYLRRSRCETKGFRLICSRRL